MKRLSAQDFKPHRLMLLLIDNYDSFVHNLARHFRLLGEETLVVRNDAIDADGIRGLAPNAVVISPGPCGPDGAGCSLDLVRRLADETPILGVCLGHQVIGQAFGAQVIRAPQPMHGKPSLVHHTGTNLFAGLANPLPVGRYHSLVVDRATLPTHLLATALTDDGVLMALRLRDRPVFGVQFHPESVLTDAGLPLLRNFLLEARSAVAPSPTEPWRLEAEAHGAP